MRKTRAILITVLAALTGLLVGCGPAICLNPLFTESDLVFDQAPMGEWTEKRPNPTSLRFEQAGPGVYRVTDIETDSKSGSVTETPYEAHLVRLGGYQFLDVTPLQLTAISDSLALGPWATSADQTQQRLVLVTDGYYIGYYIEFQGACSAGSDTPAQAHLRRGHWIFRLALSARTLKLAALDDDWLKDAIDQGQIAVAHAFLDSNNKVLVITATSADLQQLVLEHATDRKAFPDSTTFRKLK